MTDNFKDEAASHSSYSDPSFYQYNDPQRICQSFRVRIISYVNDIERLLRKKELLKDPHFLSKIAEDIVALNNMATCTECCSENIIEAGKLIHNVLNDPLTIKNACNHMTTLQLAKRYREDPSFSSCFVIALEAYKTHEQQTETLLNQLKVLAFDLND